MISPIKNDANKLIVESNEIVFSDIIVRIEHPHLYVFNFATGYARFFVVLIVFHQANDRGHLSIPSNPYTPAANTSTSHHLFKSRVRQKIICLQTDQGKGMRFFNLIVRLTCSIVPFLAVL